MKPWTIPAWVIPAWYAAVLLGGVAVAVVLRKRREAREFAAEYELLCVTEGAGEPS